MRYFMSISCVSMDEEILRTIAEKKCGLPNDAPLEEILKQLFS